MDEPVGVDLIVEPHLKAARLNSTGARLHKSRHKLFRFSARLNRPIEQAGIDTRIHTSVRTRYKRDSSYRLPRLEKLVHSRSWRQLDVGT